VYEIGIDRLIERWAEKNGIISNSISLPMKMARMCGPGEMPSLAAFMSGANVRGLALMSTLWLLVISLNIINIGNSGRIKY
jgi:hypothetical protein